MPIRMILGRENCDKSSYIYQEIGERIRQGRGRMFLIVPEQFTLGAEKELMAYNCLNGLLGADVLSLKRLCYRILSESGGITRTFVDTHGRQMLLQKSIRQAKKELRIYKKSAGRLGFLDNMAALISEMKQSGITPEMLQQPELMDGRLLGQKLEDIRTIYATFNQLLGEDRMDEDDRTDLACEKIKDTGFLDQSLIWFDGFHTFSRKDFKLIKALAAKASMLTMTLTCDLNPLAKDRQVFAVPLSTLRAMEEMACELETPVRCIDLNQKAGRTQTALAHLERELYAFQPQPYTEDTDAITIRQCRDLWDEVEWGARKIVELVRDQQMRYQDIVVLTGDLNQYGSIIQRVFTQFHIPCFMDTVQKITENPLVEAVLSAIEAVAKGFDYDTLFAFVKTGFSNISITESADLENYVMAFGIRGKDWEKPFIQNSEDYGYDLEQLNEQRIRLMAPLIRLKENMKAGRTFIKRTEALVAFLDDIHAQANIEKRIAWFEKQGNYDSMAADNQIWNILMEVFDQIAETMGDSITRLDEYTEVLKGGFASYTVGIIPGREDVVAITDPLRSRSSQMKALLVFGVNEGVLPRSSVQFNLLTDRERKHLIEKKLMFQEGSDFNQLQEMYIIYSLFSKPSDYLYLSFATMDEEGSTLGISPLIGQIRAVFPKLVIKSDLNVLEENALEKIVDAEGTLPAYIEVLREGNMTEEFQTVEQWYCQHAHYAKQCRQIQQASHYQGIDTSLKKDQARAIFEKPLAASISRLEKFRRCPFSHFVEYGLRPVSRELYHVEMPDIGSVLHQVIDGVYKAGASGDKKLSAMTAAETDLLVDTILDTVLPEVRHNVFFSSGQYQYLGRKIRRVSKKTVRVLIDQMAKGDFEFRYSEQQFIKMLEMPGLNEKIKLKGIIDRIDLYRQENGQFIKIIDYKSGKKEPSLTEVYYGLSLQLIVYLDAAMGIVDETDLIPGGTFYFHIDDPLPEVSPFTAKAVEDKINESFTLNGLYLDDKNFIEAMDREKNTKIIKLNSKNFKLSREEFDALIHYVRKTVITMAEAILNGEITVRPYKFSNQTGCDYCDFQGICQFDTTLGKACYDLISETLKRDQFFEKIMEEQTDEHAVDG